MGDCQLSLSRRNPSGDSEPFGSRRRALVLWAATVSWCLVSGSSTDAAHPDYPEEYLTFRDEFDGDLSQWLLDPSGSIVCEDDSGTGEKGATSSLSHLSGKDDADLVTISDDRLHLKSIRVRDAYPPDDPSQQDRNPCYSSTHWYGDEYDDTYPRGIYRSGGVRTANFQQRFGYFEARMRLAADTALASGFWLSVPLSLENQDIDRAEINIQESHESNRISTDLHDWTPYWPEGPPSIPDENPQQWHVPEYYCLEPDPLTGETVDLTTTFCTYAFEWTHDNRMRWYFSVDEDIDPDDPIRDVPEVCDPNDPTGDSPGDCVPEDYYDPCVSYDRLTAMNSLIPMEVRFSKYFPCAAGPPATPNPDDSDWYEVNWQMDVEYVRVYQKPGWIAESDGEWHDKGNWGLDGVPVAGWTAVFNQEASTDKTSLTISLDDDAAVQALYFDGDKIPAFTVRDNTLKLGVLRDAPAAVASKATLKGDGVGGITINHNVTRSQTITSRIKTQRPLLFANLTDASDGVELTIEGEITASEPGEVLTTMGEGPIHIEGVISSQFGDLYKDGPGVLRLAGLNQYAGETHVKNGTLVIAEDAPNNDDGALGHSNHAKVRTSSFPITGSKVEPWDYHVAILIEGDHTVERNIFIGNVNNGEGTTTLGSITDHRSEFAGEICISRELLLKAAPNGTVVFSGPLIDYRHPDSDILYPGSVVKIDQGTVVLAGENAYTGGTVVREGALRVDGSLAAASNAVTVENSGTLGGPGQIAGTVTVNDGGTIAPGASAGVLRIDGNLVFGPGASLVMEMAGLSDVPPNDRLDVGGDATLAGTLKLTALSNLAPSQPGWYGDQTRTMINVTGAGRSINGRFTAVETPQDALRHLGYGVFLTDLGTNSQAVTYRPDSVEVDLFQAAPGDTDGDRQVGGGDIENILAANFFGITEPDPPANWTHGDFTGDGEVGGSDIQAILAANLFGTGVYTALDLGTPVAAHAELRVTPDGLIIVPHDTPINGYVITSASGVFTGAPAANLGLFHEDSDTRITGNFAFALDTRHQLGDVVGDEFEAASLFDDLTFTYTVAGQPGVYVGTVTVAEPSAFTLLSAAALGLLLCTWRRHWQMI